MPLTVQTNRAGQKTQAPSLLYQNPPTFLFKMSQFRLLICDWCFAFALFALPNLSIRQLNLCMTVYKVLNIDIFLTKKHCFTSLTICRSADHVYDGWMHYFGLQNLKPRPLQL